MLELQWGQVLFTDIPLIADGRKYFDYVAWVRYEDAVTPYPIVRQTELSLRLNGDHQNGISFSYRTTHNCADTDCPD